MADSCSCFPTWKDILKSRLLERRKDMRKRLFLVVLLIPLMQIVYLPPSFAGRPLTTDDAWTVEKGKFQLELGLDATRQDNRDREYNPSITMSYGLSEKTDLGVGSGYLFTQPEEGEKENGLADTEAKLKYRWMDEKEWTPALATAAKLKIPTASETKGLGSGKPDFGINMIATKNLSKRLVLHLNVGYTFIGDGESNKELNYSLAAQYALTDRWALVGEFFGTNNLNGMTGDDPFSGLLGTYYLITESLIWDMGIETGMNNAAPDYRLTTGITLLF
jgi:hypothetical protein